MYDFRTISFSGNFRNGILRKAQAYWAAKPELKQEAGEEPICFENSFITKESISQGGQRTAALFVPVHHFATMKVKSHYKNVNPNHQPLF